jgi:antitoxin (DNA-binding transcriptional repressor) of toxin-antitoxin stability system
VTIQAAETMLSQLLARVEAGEEIVLARGKIPISKLVPFQAPQRKRRFGALRGPRRDPFDRMLIAQAMVATLVLVSNEQGFDAYGVGRLW